MSSSSVHSKALNAPLVSSPNPTPGEFSYYEQPFHIRYMMASDASLPVQQLSQNSAPSSGAETPASTASTPTYTSDDPSKTQKRGRRSRPKVKTGCSNCKYVLTLRALSRDVLADVHGIDRDASNVTKRGPLVLNASGATRNVPGTRRLVAMPCLIRNCASHPSLWKPLAPSLVPGPLQALVHSQERPSFRLAVQTAAISITNR